MWFITPEKYYQKALESYREEIKEVQAKADEFEEKFKQNQEADSSFLDEFKALDRQIKIFPYYVSFLH